MLPRLAVVCRLHGCTNMLPPLWLRDPSGHRQSQMERVFGHDREEPYGQGEAPCTEPCRRADLPHRHFTSDGYVVHTDLAEDLPVTSEEIAILRAFLSDEIRAILSDEGEGG